MIPHVKNQVTNMQPKWIKMWPYRMLFRPLLCNFMFSLQPRVKKKKNPEKNPTPTNCTALDSSRNCFFILSAAEICLTPSGPDEDCRVFCPFGSISDDAAQRSHYVWIGRGAGLILERTHSNVWSPERQILPAQHMELMVLSQSC